MKKVLVTGGTGYIGSHAAAALIMEGYEVIIVDNLINSSDKALDGIEKITGIRPKFLFYDLSILENVEKIFLEIANIDFIMHFAALKAVGESYERPLLYYRNNINSLINLLDCISKYKKNIGFIFSSSCTVYGEPNYLPVDEKHPFNKYLSPYGYTKQINENILQDFTKNYQNIKIVSLRYFNPIGAHKSGYLGESPKVPYNLIPILTQTAVGKREKMYVFGNDYDTPDGTCIRDYIHIEDLVDAHLKALKKIENNSSIPNYLVYNLGVGRGYTVLEVIRTFEKVTGKKINYEIAERRKGDIPAVYADPSLANKELNWKATKTLEEMLLSAWLWESKYKYY